MTSGVPKFRRLELRLLYHTLVVLHLLLVVECRSAIAAPRPFGLENEKTAWLYRFSRVSNFKIKIFD